MQIGPTLEETITQIAKEFDNPQLEKNLIAAAIYFQEKVGYEVEDIINAATSFASVLNENQDLISQASKIRPASAVREMMQEFF